LDFAIKTQCQVLWTKFRWFFGLLQIYSFYIHKLTSIYVLLKIAELVRYTLKKIYFHIALVIYFCIVLFVHQGLAQVNAVPNGERFRIVFYNVENLFDVYDDTLKRDNEYTPDGMRHWNNKKFYKKLNQTYKVLISVGEWDPPSVIGLCEIENRFVLNKLVYETPLKKFNYKIIHQESPDRRGIDVGLLYRPDRMEVVSYQAIHIRFPFDTASRTRDILYVKALMNEMDTVHFFVNHWPSKYGGFMATVPKRAFVASVLKTHTDSLLAINPNTNIFIMGDFNDTPGDESVLEVLGARADTIGMKNMELYNLTYPLHENWKIGTHKYQGEWSVIDQFIVSKAMMKGSAGMRISIDGPKIFHPDFLIEDDGKFMGSIPYRTFRGAKYIGGFSDHFPIYVDLEFEKSPSQ
jgi:endonuclease/exonuclease/phosphatase family metal-dependent hydrolase